MMDKPQELLSIEARRQNNFQCLMDFVNYQGEGRILYKEVFRSVRYRIGGNYHDAEDIMIDIQLKVWQNQDKYDQDRRPQAWLFTIAANACIDHLRKANLRNARVSLNKSYSVSFDTDYDQDYNYEISEEEELPIDIFARMEQFEIVKSQLLNLPDNYRKIIELVYLNGLKYREAAEKLGIPVGTAKSRLHNGILKLEELLVGRAAA